MTIEDLVLQEIDRLNEELEELEPGTKQYEATANRLHTLMDKAIEMGRINMDHEDKVVQMNEERKDRIVRNAISVAGIVLPIAVTVWGTLFTTKFEEAGSYTTIMGRGFINKLLPKK